MIHDIEDEVDDFRGEIKEIKKDQNVIKESLNSLTNTLEVMQDKQDASARARLKDRIGQSYRFYRDRGKVDENGQHIWNSMEKEAL